MNKGSYAGIDIFRFIAALMIIAIHTSPLSSFSDAGNFFLTRVISRIAVPFFMTTTGFFTLSHYAKDTRSIQKFIKNTFFIYVAAMLLYLPINIYNGYFNNRNVLSKIIEDITINGTTYHLWYLPAAITGCAIGWFLLRKFGEYGALVISFALYIIGLFGDSYWGVIERVPMLRGIYSAIFEVSHYTRNGFFYAPLFFVLGGCINEAIHRKRLKLSKLKRICCVLICLTLMTIEAFVLKNYRLMRHDSMYIFLPLCIYFLFTAIVQVKGRRVKMLRDASMILYIIHPLIIAFMRPIARSLHIEIIVSNSLLYFFIVLLASAPLAFIFTFIQKKIKPKAYSKETDRAWIEIDTNALRHNLNFLRSVAPSKSEIMAVVKDEAYGHGSFEVAINLERLGVKSFAVSTIDEGIKLRKYGIRGEILILGYSSVNRADEMRKYNLMQTLIDMDYALSLERQGIPIKTHIKIDTGMHRLGFSHEEAGKISSLFLLKNIKICGMYTHLCCSDGSSQEDKLFTQLQIDRFYNLLDQLKKIGAKIPKTHVQSSYGLLNYPQLKCDYVRIGIALYGVLSAPNSDTVIKTDLKPVLSLKGNVSLIRDISIGDSVGYGRCFIADKNMRIAVISVGYGDGFPRCLSEKNIFASINGYDCPVIGRICMDQLTVDITDAEKVSVGDAATLIGSSRFSSDKAARAAETITNELLCGMSARLPIIEK